MSRKDGDKVSTRTPPLKQQPAVRRDNAEGTERRLACPETKRKNKQTNKQKQKFKVHLDYMGRKSIY